MLELEERGGGVKVLGGILIAVGLLWAVFAFNMPTTVQAGGDRIGSGAYSFELPKVTVNNLGLMEERRNHLMMAGVTVLAGILLFGFGSVQRGEATNPAPSEVFRVCPHCAEHVKPNAKICRFCNRELPSPDEASKAALQRAIDEGASDAEVQALAEAQKPKGLCPNCGYVLPLDAQECPKCKASFGVGSTWAVKPVQSA